MPLDPTLPRNFSRPSAPRQAQSSPHIQTGWTHAAPVLATHHEPLAVYQGYDDSHATAIPYGAPFVPMQYGMQKPAQAYYPMQTLQPFAPTQPMQTPHYAVAVPSIQEPVPHGFRTPLNAATLGEFNTALESVRHDLNKTMTPLQRRLGRSLTIIGSVAALGGGVAAGMLGLSALGAAASTVGLPVAAVAGIAAAAVFLGGTALAVMFGAMARSITRKSLQNDPDLQAKLGAVRSLREGLLSRGKLNPAEKKLLANANRVLSKVDGFGSHVKSQLKVAGKTDAWTVGGTFFSAFFVVAAGSSIFALAGGSGSSGMRGAAELFSAKGPRLKGDRLAPVQVADAQMLLSIMQRRETLP